MSNRRQNILDILDDLVGKFMYYDRKESETLSMGAIEAAVKAGEITVDEMIEQFGSVLNRRFE
tara:strand:- start:5812 stop:6000 length:189 start_codon:yes stop_codon:yes gene_type:complete